MSFCSLLAHGPRAPWAPPTIPVSTQTLGLCLLQATADLVVLPQMALWPVPFQSTTSGI